MTQDAPGQDPEGEDARIKVLAERLKRADAAEMVRTGNVTGADAGEGYRLGNRVLGELIGGIAGGAIVGWVLDRLAGTSPWALLAFLFMGIIVAFRNIIRLSSKRPKQ